MRNDCYHLLAAVTVGVFFSLYASFCLAAEDRSKLENEIIKMIPGGEITVDLVLGLGYKRSDQVSLIKKQLELSQVSESETRGQFGISRNVTSSLAYSSDKNERQPNFPSPESNISQQFQSVYRQGFEYGLSFDASSTFQNIETVWPVTLSPGAQGSRSDVSYAQSEWSLGIEQKLWRNGFGKASMASLNAAKLDRDIFAADVDSQLSDWGVQIVGVFYEAWLAQRSVDAQLERLQTQKRLAKISRLSERRGTLDRADVLNIESQVLSAEQGLEQSQKVLQDVWRSLVIALKLPEPFLKVNPEKVPIGTVDYSQGIGRMCNAAALEIITSDINPSLRALIKQQQAAELRLMALKSQEDPDLFFRLSYTANGLDERFNKTLTESLNGSHPGFQAILGFSMDLDNHSLKAQRQRQQTGLSQLALNLSSRKDQLRVDWMNRCKETDRLNESIRIQNKILRMNRERVKLEEQRFRLGRIDMVSVIQASNDLISSRLSLQRAQGELAKNYWSLKSLVGEMPEQLTVLASSTLLERF